MPSSAEVRPVRLRPAMSSGPASRSGWIGETASASTPTAIAGAVRGGELLGGDLGRHRRHRGGAAARDLRGDPVAEGADPLGLHRRTDAAGGGHLDQPPPDQAGAGRGVDVEHLAGHAEHQVVVGGGHPQDGPGAEGRGQGGRHADPARGRRDHVHADAAAVLEHLLEVLEVLAVERAAALQVLDQRGQVVDEQVDAGQPDAVPGQVVDVGAAALGQGLGALGGGALEQPQQPHHPAGLALGHDRGHGRAAGRWG